jgi:hypothetical protein
MGFVDGISRALAYFFAAWWIWAMYRAGLLLHKGHRSKLKALAFILAVAGVLTCMSWSTLGEHFDDENADPLGGPASLAANEDETPPTPAQRNRAATTVFLITFLPLAAGGLQKHDPTSRVKSKGA